MVEKLIHQLILAGLHKNATGQIFTQFYSRVEDTVNNDILGRSSCNSEIGQWRVPLDKNDAKKLGDVKLSGASLTKFLAGLEHLARTCTADYRDEYTTEWILAFDQFVGVIKNLKSKEEFYQASIDKFQLEADEFCDVYCGLTGRDGMTNRFHILR